jgi:pilus assembly protein CpaF
VSVAANSRLDNRYMEALGPLRPLVEDDSLTEIMVNGPEMVYVERKGKILLTDIRFDDEAHLMRVIDTIVSSVGRRVDARTPLCDARLLDGSRVNAAIPPVALDGPLLTIRKFSKDPYQVSDLIGFGTITQEGASFIQACVLARANIIVSGGTGTGKTTLLNVCSGFIPIDERIITIEDAAELQLHQEHVCRLESRPPDVNGEGRVNIRDLVVNSLRMRPDRIVVGECRSGEALDMLQAMNTGHDGSMTTIHANSPRETLSRLETLVLMAGMDLPLKAIRQQVASAVNLIIQLARLKDGSRKIISVTEVVGMEGDTITMQEIFKFESRGADPATGKIVGDFSSTGIRPKIIDRLFDMGVPLPPRLAQLFPDRRQLQQEALMAAASRKMGNGAAQPTQPPPGFGGPPGLGLPPSMPPGMGMPPVGPGGPRGR